MIDKQKINDFIQDNEINPRIIVESEVHSTNLYAKDLISKGLNTNTIILAEKQDSGKGRYDREWHSPKGGLYMTIILQPTNAILSYPLYGFALACAAACALEDLKGPAISLKWPNDLLSGERKIGGILSELIATISDHPKIVMGIGININNEASSLPESIRNISTSVVSETGRQLVIEHLAAKIINNLDDYLSEGRDPSGILRDFRKRCTTIGRQVEVDTAGQLFSGRAMDVTDDGSLIIRDQYNNEQIVSAGEVSHLRSDQ
ncbi:MAG: biotin--[acetyl-CoA-carboxylase] ligase [Candidatus Thorarchaeota archaeon]|nr:biotin--[acetyl-CoA-carboxylase] ligase [Candidatus Thorarchaeota archaeon]